MVPGRPFAIFSLLQHEHKKTVLNFTVQRNTEYDGSVRSKVMYGYALFTPCSRSSWIGPPHFVCRPQTNAGEPDIQPTHTRGRQRREQRAQV